MQILKKLNLFFFKHGFEQAPISSNVLHLHGTAPLIFFFLSIESNIQRYSSMVSVQITNIEYISRGKGISPLAHSFVDFIRLFQNRNTVNLCMKK